MSLVCPRCSYRCKLQLDLIKHSMDTHSLEQTFHLKCGIRGCLHTFTFGSTFSSFKTHANRNHSNWQAYLKSDENASSVPSPLSPLPELSSHPIDDPPTEFTYNEIDHHEGDYVPAFAELSKHDIPQSSLDRSRSPQYTAAMFLLAFKEKYKLSQKAINFSVDSINSIVRSTCESIKSSVKESLSKGLTGNDIMDCFDHVDPFDSLDTEYKQSKFYRENFGLVVCIFSLK